MNNSYVNDKNLFYYFMTPSCFSQAHDLFSGESSAMDYMARQMSCPSCA
jgi:hypothetical protein